MAIVRQSTIYISSLVAGVGIDLALTAIYDSSGLLRSMILHSPGSVIWLSLYFIFPAVAALTILFLIGYRSRMEYFGEVAVALCLLIPVIAFCISAYINCHLTKCVFL